jgi:hypothetical protein
MEVAEKNRMRELEAQILVNKRIDIKPIVRGSSWLEKGHDGEFMYTGSVRSYVLPLDRNTNQLKTILTQDEMEFFENKLQLEKGTLSFYKKNNAFWAKFTVKVGKEGDSLNLADPIDNLKHRVLLANKEIAPSPEERMNSIHYKFMLVDKDYETEERAKKSNVLRDAYKALAKLESSETRMRDVLRIYGKKPAVGATREFLVSELDKLIETDVKGFLAIVQDSDYETRVLLEDAIECRAIVKKDKTGYALPGGDKIANNTPEVITWLKSPKNSEELLTIKAKIENNTK